MTGRIHTYYFCRLNMVGHIPDKYQLLYDSLRSDELVNLGKFKYGFFDANEIEYNNKLFAYGVIVKYKSLLEGEIVDEERHEVIEGGLPKGVVTKSKFFLHYETGVIAYHPVTSRLSENQFKVVFASIIEAANHNFFIQAVLESIDEEMHIREAIQRFQKINRVSFSINPTNPSNRLEYKELDDRLKELRAKKMNQQMEAEEGGFNKNALLDDDSYKAILMAADGYGSASISGEADGRRITINTSESPVKTEIIDSDDPMILLQSLYPHFEQIWNRKER